ncbi:MAG TPA: hypothetical protein VF121_08155 [Thermoanaerobaculia bacterium]|nr:hypothetical protein [Thermoanaerobaculia bacterium]
MLDDLVDSMLGRTARLNDEEDVGGGRVGRDDLSGELDETELAALRRQAPGMRIVGVHQASVGREAAVLRDSPSDRRSGRPSAEAAAAPKRHRDAGESEHDASGPTRRESSVKFVEIEPEGADRTDVDRVIERRYAAIIGKRVIVPDAGE